MVDSGDDGHEELERPSAGMQLRGEAAQRGGAHQILRAENDRAPAREGHAQDATGGRPVRFDVQYKVTPMGTRLRYEWNEKWGESSERVAWYSYDWANSVYASVCITLFMPLLLTVLAQRAASSQGPAESAELSECAGTCSRSAGCPLAVQECRACVSNEGHWLWNGEKFEDLPTRTVWFFGQVEAFTFATRVLSVSVLFQAFVFITFGALADYGSGRKWGLAISAFGGCGATVAMMFVSDPSAYLAAAWLTIASNVGFGASCVFYNAYLPILVDLHPEVRQSVGTENEEKVRDEVSTFMSSVGFCCGYVSGFLMVLVTIALQLSIGNSELNGNLGDRVAIATGGIWWGAWSVYTLRNLKLHPGKAVVAGEWMITKGWESTVLTLRKAASFPETTKFLISYFFYSDSYSTIGSIGVLVMQQHMCMPSFMIAVVLLEVLVFAAAGSMLAIRVQHTWRLEPKQMIFACLCGYVVLCLLGILGLVPGSPVGLKSVPEAFFFGALHGLLMGPVQSYSRTLFSDLIIPGQESEFFALYEITDKGSSWLGPLVAGELYRATGSIHAGFIYLLFMTILPAMLLLTVDHRKGVQEVQGLASSGTSLRSSKLQLSEQRLLEDEEGEEGHGGGGAGECEEGVGGVRGGLGCSVDGSTVAVSVAT